MEDLGVKVVFLGFFDSYGIVVEEEEVSGVILCFEVIFVLFGEFGVCGIFGGGKGIVSDCWVLLY